MECPMCGMEREEGEALYECIECAEEGCDCCVPGNGMLCDACEDVDYDYGDDEEENEDEDEEPQEA